MLFTTFTALTFALSVAAAPAPQFQSNWINVAGNAAGSQIVQASISGNKANGLQLNNFLAAGNVGQTQQFTGGIVNNAAQFQGNNVAFAGNLAANQQFTGGVANNMAFQQLSGVAFAGNQAANFQGTTGIIANNGAAGNQGNTIAQNGNAAGGVQNANLAITDNGAAGQQSNSVNFGGPKPEEKKDDKNDNKNTAGMDVLFLNSSPELPKALADEVAKGNQIHAFTLLAKGTQNYNCNATATGFAWALREPEAELFVALPDKNGAVSLRHVGTHGFTSPFFVNPFWTINEKGCSATIDFLPLARADSPQGPTNIAWLATKRATTTAKTATKPEGCSTLTTKLYLGSTLMLRLNTVGGVAPPAGECKAETKDKVVKVPYTTAYWAYVDPKESGRSLVDVIDASISG
ncbi:hypothetical protein HDU96_007621 [Phlyctochytrium bullatum]|nr:hypothetical protein HDU96_007621 [Phlyctochytrium bullatum]